MTSDLGCGPMTEDATAESQRGNPVCWECGGDIADNTEVTLTEIWRHAGCDPSLKRPPIEPLPVLDRATDPRSPAFIDGIRDGLRSASILIDQWQRKLDTEARILRGGRKALEERLDALRVGIASAVNEDGKPLYSNDDKRRVALVAQQREDGLCEELQHSIWESEERVSTLQRDLEQLGRDRADLLSEARLAAAWLSFAAGETGRTDR